MKTYKCLVTDSSGKTYKLIRNGNSIQEVSDSFLSTPFIPLEIREDSSGKKTLRKNSKASLEFTQIMEHLLESGLSLKDAVEISAEINKKSKSSIISEEILSQINKGTTFAAAVNNLDQFFSPVYRGIISVGDKVGSVEKIFPRLRVYLESSTKIREKLKGALLYPSLILFTAVFGTLAMTLFVLPKLQIMFQEFGGEAAATLRQNILNLESFSIVFFALLIIIFITGMTFARKRKTNIRIKRKIDTFLLKVPFINNLIISWQTLNFSFAMETLTAGGVTVENAIEEAKNVVTNEFYKESFNNVVSDIRKGIPLSTAFSTQKVFPSYLSTWILVGEKSGKTEKVFSHIRNYFQNEIDRRSNQFMTLIEPLLIILVGLILLVLVLTVVVPVFSLYGSIL